MQPIHNQEPETTVPCRPRIVKNGARRLRLARPLYSSSYEAFNSELVAVMRPGQRASLPPSPDASTFLGGTTDADAGPRTGIER